MNQFHRMSAVGRASWLRKKFVSQGMVNSSALMLHFLNQMIPFLDLGKHLDGNSSAEKYLHYQVHRLIEECILFNMSREECMDALSKHASIRPLITSTVWKELEKANQGFFEAYSKQISERVRQTGRGSGREMLSDPTKLQL